MVAHNHLLCLLLLLALTGFAPASAEETTRQTVALSQPVFEGLQEAQQQIESKQFSAGLKILRALLKTSELSAYETAQIWNLSAYAFYLQEDYKKAIGAYNNVLKQKDLPEGLVQSSLKTLSQLYFTVEAYDRALSTVNRLISVVPDPSAEIYMLKGQAHFQLEQYRLALDPIRTGIDKHRAQGRQPQENWLLLLRVCYYELRDFDNMLAVLREMIRLYPKPQYVATLAGVYSELGDTRKQMVLTEALYEAGLVDQASQIVNLANLYLVHDLPYKAAQLLDGEVQQDRVEASERNLRLLSQAWYEAREDAKAIAPLARAAAMSADGELYVRLAQSYINLERWSDAAEAVRQGLARGGVRRTDIANIMLGMALFNEKKLAAARKAFIAAAGDKRSSKAAQQWIAYVDSELEREQTLDQVLPKARRREQDAILQNL